jgi:fructokinase
MRGFFRNFGRALAGVAALLDPDIIVVGGGVSNLEDILVRGAEAMAGQLVPYAAAPPLVRGRLGDVAGAVGAALLSVSG